MRAQKGCLLRQTDIKVSTSRTYGTGEYWWHTFLESKSSGCDDNKNSDETIEAIIIAVKSIENRTHFSQNTPSCYFTINVCILFIWNSTTTDVSFSCLGNIYIFSDFNLCWTDFTIIRGTYVYNHYTLARLRI